MFKLIKNVSFGDSKILNIRLFVKYKRKYSGYPKMRYDLENDITFIKYQESVEKLNELQPVQAPVSYDDVSLRSLRLLSTKLMCKKLDINDEKINSLNAIHITGTKGKGSTSAFSESILRNMGFKTGLFTSPHLIEVKERIRINGQSLSYTKFHEYFTHCHDILIKNWSKEDSFDKPTYFQFLTVMAFYVFYHEKVDTAIIEVGIGGEYDFTNIIEKPIACGISSLGLDHCSLLGNTIEQIAWQKSGILKRSCVGFISQQDSKGPLNVIRDRSIELNANVCLVNKVDEYKDLESNIVDLGLNGKVQYLNSQLALYITSYWLNYKTQENFDKNKWIQENTDYLSEEGIPVLKPITVLDDIKKKGVSNCKWPGRNQIIQSDNQKIKYYIDGAHTVESIDQFLNWFLDLKKNDPNYKNEKTVLLFNYTGERDPSKFLELLTKIKLDSAAFSKLKSYPDKLNKEKDTFRKMPSAILDNDEKYENLLSLYNDIFVKKSKSDLNNNCVVPSAKIFDNILEGLNWLTDSKDDVLKSQLNEFNLNESNDIQSDNLDKNINVLITGSLYLVGLTLKVLNYKID